MEQAMWPRRARLLRAGRGRPEPPAGVPAEVPPNLPKSPGHICGTRPHIPYLGRYNARSLCRGQAGGTARASGGGSPSSFFFSLFLLFSSMLFFFSFPSFLSFLSSNLSSNKSKLEQYFISKILFKLFNLLDTKSMQHPTNLIYEINHK
jgi:hypothetical protein